MQDRVARYLEKIDGTPGEDGVSAADRTLEEMLQRMTGALTVEKDGEVVPVYQGLPEICKEWDVPYGKVLAWLMADAERYAVYQRALEVQAHGLVSEVVAIADGNKNDVARDKLRVETRFRVAKHHAAKVYGEKVEHSHVGAPVFSVVINTGNAGGADGGAVIERAEVVSGDEAVL